MTRRPADFFEVPGLDGLAGEEPRAPTVNIVVETESTRPAQAPELTFPEIAETMLAPPLVRRLREAASFDPSVDEPTESLEPEGLLGREIAGHQVRSILGAGASAVVFRVTQAGDGQARALKVLKPKEARDPIARKRLLREAKLLAAIDHPNVVRVLESGLLDDRVPYLLMELVAGRSLRSIVEVDAPMDPGRVRSHALQLARALDAAHSAGIIHRDLKPQNVLVVERAGDEQLKVVDFGLGRGTNADETRLTRAAETLGTPLYMSPEQIDDATLAGPAADLYALGVTLHMMLTSRPPFRASSIEALFEAHRHAPRPDLSALGPLGTLVERLLDVDPSRRPSARELVETLEASPQLSTDFGPNDEPSTLRSGVRRLRPPSIPAQGPARPRSRVVWLTVLAVGSLAFVLGFFGWERLGGSKPNSSTDIDPGPAESSPRSARAQYALPRAPQPPESPEQQAEQPTLPDADKHEASIARPKPQRPKPASKTPRPKLSLDAILRAHHLRRQDLPLLGLGTYARGPLTSPEALDGVLRSTPLRTEFVSARLDRVLGKLKGSSLSLDELRTLERRYLELRRRSLSKDDPTALNRDVDRLEDEVDVEHTIR